MLLHNTYVHQPVLDFLASCDFIENINVSTGSSKDAKRVVVVNVSDDNSVKETHIELDKPQYSDVMFSSFFTFENSDTSLELEGSVSLSINEKFISVNIKTDVYATSCVNLRKKTLLEDISNSISLIFEPQKVDFACNYLKTAIAYLLEETLKTIQANYGKPQLVSHPRQVLFKESVTYLNDLLASETINCFGVSKKTGLVLEVGTKEFNPLQINVIGTECILLTNAEGLEFTFDHEAKGIDLPTTLYETVDLIPTLLEEASIASNRSQPLLG